jgi:type IV pilus assembly protein PilQ
MMRHSLQAIILAVLISLTQFSLAESANFSLDLQRVNVAEAIRLMAKFLGKNVMVSSAVQGTVTLHLHHAISEQALDMLLMTQGLTKWEKDDLWFIAPHEELIKQQQQEVKWRTSKDDSSPLIIKTWKIQYAKAEEIAKILQDDHTTFLSKRGWVRSDARTNSVLLQDLPQQVGIAQQLIEKLDVPVKQILIEARLISVDNDFERELGIHYANMPSSYVEGKSFIHNVGQYSLAVAKLADGSLLDVKLAALENAGHARLISSPSLFTANQQSASIEAGEEIPYQEVSESGGTATVFKKAVLGLKVTPQVLPGHNVLLHMQINQDRPSNKMVQGVPTISTRQIITSILIKNGQTVVLGGIYETDRENGEQRLPFISQIPVIGVLFKQTHRRENRRELLIFVTPKVMT